MQVHDTPVRLDSEDFAVTVNVGSGGAGVYYGTSSDPVVLASSGTLVAAGGSFVLTTPVWVVSATHGQTADLQLISSSLGSVDLGVAAWAGAAAGDQPYWDGAEVARMTRPTITLPAGATDSGANLTAALTLLGTNGGHLRLAPGDHTWSTTPALPRALVGHLLIDGPGATVHLSSAAPRFLDFNKVADHDVFQNITVQDLRIDANSVGGSHHVIVGTLQGGTFQTRIGFDRITLRRITTYNVAGDSTNTIDRRNVSLIVAHPGDNEATQDTITNLVCEDLVLNGGSYGIQFGATSPGRSANVYCDRIAFHRCYHDTQQTYAANAGGANFFGPSSGYGGSLVIRDCKGLRSGDVGIEVDAMTNAYVTDTVIQDAVGSAFFSRNFHTPEYATAQTHRYTNCDAKIVTLNPDSAGGISGRGFEIGHTSAPSPTLGHVLIQNCTYRSAAANLNITGSGLYAPGNPVSRLTVRNFTLAHDSLNYAPATGKFPVLARLYFSGTSHVTIDGLYMKLVGTLTGGAGSVGPQGLDMSSNASGDMTFTIRDVRWDQNTTNTGQEIVLRFGQSTGTMRGSIERCRIPAAITGGSGGGVGINFTGTGSLTIGSDIRLDEIDWSKIPAGWTEVNFSATTNAGKVRVRRSAFRLYQQERRAVAANTTLSGYEETVAVTDTTAARTITLPALTAVPAGTRLLVVDESNAAGTNNITVARAGSDTFVGGATSKAIATNGGGLEITSTGTAWLARALAAVA